MDTLRLTVLEPQNVQHVGCVQSIGGLVDWWTKLVDWTTELISYLEINEMHYPVDLLDCIASYCPQ